jgi:hypothetical protein
VVVVVVGVVVSNFYYCLNNTSFCVLSFMYIYVSVLYVSFVRF